MAFLEEVVIWVRMFEERVLRWKVPILVKIFSILGTISFIAEIPSSKSWYFASGRGVWRVVVSLAN